MGNDNSAAQHPDIIGIGIENNQNVFLVGETIRGKVLINQTKPFAASKLEI